MNRQPFSAQSEFAIAAGDTPPGPVQFQRAEMKFQYSLQARPWRSEHHTWGAWLAFTQQSFWQVYNGGLSRPFRETNYMPEAILTWHPSCERTGERPPCDVAGMQGRMVNIGYAHQSSGRGGNLSLSWNRLCAQFGFDRRVDASNAIALLVRPWVRIKESGGAFRMGCATIPAREAGVAQW